jgi:aryl carrier-like protein
MSYAEWKHVIDAKIRGSWNLHTALPIGLDFFILLSSMSGCIGFQSQAHYGSGNTYQDRLARFRLAAGERAVSLNLGPIDLDGPKYRTAVFRGLVFNSGYHLIQSATDLCALLEYVCSQEGKVNRTQEMAQIVMGIEDPATIRASGRTVPQWMQRALFSHFHTRGSEKSSADENGNIKTLQENKRAIGTLLSSAPNDDDAATVATNALIQKLSSILSLPLDTFETHKPMHAYGIDSLVAIELRNWFSKELEADVAVFDIMGEATLAAIGDLVSKRSSLRKKKGGIIS